MLSFKIEEIDYLTYQLYNASKSKLVKRKRLRNHIILPILYLVFGIAAYTVGNQIYIGIVFGGLALLWLISYPFYSKWLYKDHYKKHIRANNKEMFGRTVSLTLNEDKLLISDTNNESRISIFEIESINEISTHIFIKLKTGASLIIPKASFKDLKVMATFIGHLCRSRGLKIVKELDWKWK